jgi:hypothetical protein
MPAMVVLETNGIRPMVRAAAAGAAEHQLRQARSAEMADFTAVAEADQGLMLEIHPMPEVARRALSSSHTLRVAHRRVRGVFR